MWIVAGVIAFMGFLGELVVMFASNGAPQEAAGSAIILAFVVPAYVMARVLEAGTQRKWRSEMLAAIREAAEKTQPKSP